MHHNGSAIKFSLDNSVIKEGANNISSAFAFRIIKGGPGCPLLEFNFSQDNYTTR